MNEIDLTKTLLSEIDLERVDYEKSYIELNNNPEKIMRIKKLDDGRYRFSTNGYNIGWTFLNNGKHQYNPQTVTLHLFYKEEKQEMQDKHPIVIEYQDLGDKVKIVKIEGVMSYDEIVKHTGQHTTDEYFKSCQPCMYFDVNKLRLYHKVKDGVFISVSLYIDDKYDKRSFMDYVESMKLSAKRLAELIKESKAVKRIVI